MTTTQELADQSAPLDALLVQAALGPLRRFAPDLSTAKWVAGLAATPHDARCVGCATWPPRPAGSPRHVVAVTGGA